MGNEKSALSGLEVDEKAIEITDFWLHHNAVIQGSNPQNLSVFISEPSLHSWANFGRPSPLERNAKNLMLYRHPCILKYVSSWHRGSKFFLATEEVRPLVQVISSLTTLQICIGLHSILRALIFLHKNVRASHNNVCSSSIYVTSEGFWKLGGLEHLCKCSEVITAHIKKTKNYRYEKAIPPEEKEMKSDIPLDPYAIDQFAFGVLAEEVLASKNSDDVPALAEFSDLCKRHLQNVEPLLRPKLPSLLSHPFFTHDFIKIHAFLMELPLKSEDDKQEFFLNLVKQLRMFPEKIVAEQLGKLLLSRMVLLDFTAQARLLPVVLRPKEENSDTECGLFTVSTFKSYLVPKILQMFCVRDVSIRLLLLSHFNSFMHVFQTDELKSQLLPELLVGIKDNNDTLVSTTLRALADLVSILGAATVIGGNRGKLFTDGRPNKVNKHVETKSDTKDGGKLISTLKVPISANNVIFDLPERLSPDGGEDRLESNFAFTEDETTWSDWEAQESTNNDHDLVKSVLEKVTESIETPVSESHVSNVDSSNSKDVNDKSKYNKKVLMSDISELDIKHSKQPHQITDEIDFFTDMEPVIQKPQVLCIEEAVSSKSMFDVNINSTIEEDQNNGWNEDLNDWGMDVTSESKN
ncbi:protein-associating with the carboxyl-terminal domain of ezrin [Orussus abietinus]|uniref:protein-associating with the carboxyl-terminal domain of ezrin n=1 Tax=Orussus abietinus TaxID=222816 RepID=UPI0006269089|nr:protein-associating with the carboxyl-terminal domain of ezrin [Orussus abietinus]